MFVTSVCKKKQKSSFFPSPNMDMSDSDVYDIRLQKKIKKIHPLRHPVNPLLFLLPCLKNHLSRH